MYDGTPNLGLASIMHVLDREFPQISYERFDVRAKGEVPDLDHDIYVFTGGPGHPLDGVEEWGADLFGLIDGIRDHNKKQVSRKFVLFICHSFQIACHHFGIGEITRRKKDSFGIYPVIKTEGGKRDALFSFLPQPFYVADFRSYQVVRPKKKQLASSGVTIMATEDPDHHRFKDLALMAIRFTPEMYGVQFHPEAYPQGMEEYFTEKKRKKQIIKTHGHAVYEEMMFHLRDPIKIGLTHRRLLPGFLEFATEYLSSGKIAS